MIAREKVLTTKEVQTWTEVMLKKLRNDVQVDTANEVSRQIRRVTTIPDIIGFECVYPNFENFLTNIHKQVTNNAVE